MKTQKYTLKDWIFTVIISIFLLVVCAGTLTDGVPYWGDDSAAYISEGISIANGSFEEQVRKNYMMHPTEISSEAESDRLVYVWGYPLLLAGIYRIVGFDRIHYTSIRWYKIPLLLSLSFLGGVLYLFYRRRFSTGVSALLSLLICLSFKLVEDLNILYSDLLFLFFSMLCLLLMEIFSESAIYALNINECDIKKNVTGSDSRTSADKKDSASREEKLYAGTSADKRGSDFRGGKLYGGGDADKKGAEDVIETRGRHGRARTLILAIIYGAALWFTHELRLNGKTVCLIAVLGHVVYLIKNRNYIDTKKRYLPVHLLPYLIMVILTLVSEQILLAPATSNLSHVGTASREIIKSNIQFYRAILFDYMNTLPGIHLPCAAYFVIGTCLLGVLIKGIADNIHLTFLLLGTLIVDVSLPYVQGLRYIYNILPLMIMFSAYGIRLLWQWLCRLGGFSQAIRTYLKLSCAIMLLIMPVINVGYMSFNNMAHKTQTKDNDVYSAEAVDMYRYIQSNVPEDKKIAFTKPRFLYLNTERVSIRPGCNRHTIAEADYYLKYDSDYSEFNVDKEEAAVTPMKEVYRNQLFTLYEVNR